MSMSAKVKRDPRFRRVQMPKNATVRALITTFKNFIDQFDVEDYDRPVDVPGIEELRAVFRDEEAGNGAGSLQGDETA
ncbi:hypothetical protein [Laceyella putida]|uniref:Uncharacterized protein n=1 Tax=Laceyella putida TaxID=110101 RepID=A0ABW2RLZ5_9BACL